MRCSARGPGAGGAAEDSRQASSGEVNWIPGQGGRVWKGTGDGVCAVFPSPAAAIAAALDGHGDGKPDLAVANFGSNTVSVLLNNGNGTFAAKVDYPTGWNPHSAPSASDASGRCCKPEFNAKPRTGTVARFARM